MMNRNLSTIKTALAVDTYLPYTMSWIFRQAISPYIDTSLIICHKRENTEYFRHENILLLREEPYWKRAFRAKLWLYFGKQPIKIKNQHRNLIINSLKLNKIKLLHVHFGTYAVQFANICSDLKIPMIVTFHGHDISSAFRRWPAYEKAFPILLEKLTYALAISEEMKQRLIQLGCPEEKVLVSYLGVPLDEFPFLERSVKQNSPVIFLHAGRLTAKKGVPDLIKAFCMAFPERGKAELWIVGDGEEKDAILNTINEQDVSTYVKFYGRKSNSELLNIRYQADVFVLNCRTDYAGTKEGLPIATLEAAATGLPTISTFHAGIPESIIEGETGFLVPEYDNAAFADAMHKMMDDFTRLQMGKKARLFMEQKFSLERCNAVLSKIYKEAISK